MLNNTTGRQKGCSVELFRANHKFEEICSVTAKVTDLGKWEEYFRLSDGTHKNKNVGKALTPIQIKRPDGELCYLITSRLLKEQFEKYYNNMDNYPEILELRSARGLQLLNAKKDVSMPSTINP